MKKRRKLLSVVTALALALSIFNVPLAGLGAIEASAETSSYGIYMEVSNGDGEFQPTAVKGETVKVNMSTMYATEPQDYFYVADPAAVSDGEIQLESGSLEWSSSDASVAAFKNDVWDGEGENIVSTTYEKTFEGYSGGMSVHYRSEGTAEITVTAIENTSGDGEEDTTETRTEIGSFTVEVMDLNIQYAEPDSQGGIGEWNVVSDWDYQLPDMAVGEKLMLRAVDIDWTEEYVESEDSYMTNVEPTVVQGAVFSVQGEAVTLEQGDEYWTLTANSAANDVQITATEEISEEFSNTISCTVDTKQYQYGIYEWDENWDPKLIESKYINISTRQEKSPSDSYWLDYAEEDVDRNLNGQITWDSSNPDIVEFEQDFEKYGNAGVNILYLGAGKTTISAYINGLETAAASFELQIADIDVQYVSMNELGEEESVEDSWRYIYNDEISLNIDNTNEAVAVRAITSDYDDEHGDFSSTAIENADFSIQDDTVAEITADEAGYYLITPKKIGKTTLTVTDANDEDNTVTYDLRVYGTAKDKDADNGTTYYQLNVDGASLYAVGADWAGVIPETVQVKETGDTYDVTKIEDYLYTIEENGDAVDGLDITKVQIPATVTEIGSDAFAEAKNLAEIIVVAGNAAYCSDEQGVLYAKKDSEGSSTDGWGLFLYPAKCAVTAYEMPETLGSDESTGVVDTIFNPIRNSVLTSITIPSGMTRIESGVFTNADKLESINVAEDNKAYETKDGVLFALEIVGSEGAYDKENDVWEQVDIIEKWLYTYPAAKAGTSYDVPEDTDGIEYGAFLSDSLKTVSIPKGVTNISEGAFYYADGLTAINVASENEFYVSEDGVLFEVYQSTIYDDEGEEIGEKLIKELRTYPAGKPDMRYAIPEGTTELGWSAFDSEEMEYALKVLVIPESLTLDASDEGWIFYSFRKYNADDEFIGWNIKFFIKGSNASAVAYAESCDPQIPYVVGKSDKVSDAVITLDGTSHIYTGAAITPRVTVKLDGKTLVQNTDYTVAYANNVNPGTATVTITGKDFYTGTKNATFTITKPTDTTTNNNTGSAPPAEGTVLKDTDGTAKYEVTESKTGDVEVSYAAPVNKNKTSVTIPATVTLADGTKAAVTAIEAKAFKGNKKVKKVKIGSNVKTIGKEAFSGAKKLTTVTMGKNVTTIGSKAFYKAEALKKIAVPAKTTKIGKNAFDGCKKLASVSLGKSVKTIDSSAFANCPALKKLTLPAKVTTIGSKAFYKNKNMKTITIKSTKLKKVGKNAFKGISSKAKVKVPKSKVKAYTKLLKKAGLPSKAKVTK